MDEGKPKPGDAPAAAAPTPRTLRVEHPDREFEGELFGLQFKAGICQTADGIKAHASQEAGCKVYEAATDKPSWG